MRLLLSVDPGVSSGFAYFTDGVLSECGAGPTVPIKAAVTDFMIEIPQVYSARNSKGDPNDLITLAVQAGRYIERVSTIAPLANIHTILPRTWKGTMDKDKHNARVFMALPVSEQEVVRKCAKGLGKKALSDLIDAVGLGKYFLRMGM